MATKGTSRELLMAETGATWELEIVDCGRTITRKKIRRRKAYYGGRGGNDGETHTDPPPNWVWVVCEDCPRFDGCEEGQTAVYGAEADAGELACETVPTVAIGPEPGETRPRSPFAKRRG